MTYKKAAKVIYRSGEDEAVRLICLISKRLRLSKKEISELKRKIQVLEGRLSKNSRNSHKPPSLDGLNKPKPKSLRKKTERKTGGQKGHKGHTLKMVKHPDNIKVYSVVQCKNCGCLLKDEPSQGIKNRQVFDIPPVQIEVTEHQAEIKKCPLCNHRNNAEFPKEVKAPVQYGSQLNSIITYLKIYQLLPYKRTCELLYDLFNVNLSQGTIATITKSCSDIIQKPLERIMDCLIKSDVNHFDETGCRVKGALHWMHVASNPKFTYIGVHQKRGKEAIDDIGILPRFKGRAIHDAFKPYFRYDGLHGLCNAHHLRELTYIHEQEGHQWAKQMKDCLMDIKRAVEQASQTSNQLPQHEAHAFETLYQLILEAGCYKNPPPESNSKGKNTRGRSKKTKARNLLERLLLRKEETLAFMHDFNVPFDNNQAERDFRMVKVQQKISGTFRSETGAENFCRIRSYISTAKKNSVNPIGVLSDAIADKPFMPILYRVPE